MIKYIYLVLGICFGIMIQTFLVYVDGQTVFCDKELFIYFLHNDLDGMIGCINASDVQQDFRIMELEEKVTRIDNQTKTINGNTTNDK